MVMVGYAGAMRPRTIERREFLATTGVAAAALWTKPDEHVPPTAPTAPAASGLRTISYNVLACRGFNGGKAGDAAAVRRMASQIPARIALELALHKPDIVTFQESPKEPVVADIAQRMGMDYVYFRGGFPGTVMSRFPIVESQNCPLAQGKRPSDLFTRHWGKAILRMEGADLAVYTAHLYPGVDGHERRLREVPLMLAAMRDDIESGRPMILQGDLNHTPAAAEYQSWVDAGLRDCFEARGTGQDLTIPSTTPRKHIDYIWTHGSLPTALQECRVLFEGSFRTNPEDSTSVALSDHIPLLAVFENPK
jgi:endonuclease/exonuclease/phosphatase family metal-dependent hydrolase